MWGDNTNGLSLKGLLRPTDRSSAIRSNYIMIIVSLLGFQILLGQNKLENVSLS